MSLPELPSHLRQLLDELGSFGLVGAWLLTESAPFVSYDQPADTSIGLADLALLPDEDDVASARALDFRHARWLLVLSLDEGAGLVAPPGLSTLVSQPGYCRKCGCSDANPCQTPAGPCAWVAPDLCSACAEHSAQPGLLDATHPDEEAT